MMPEALTIKEAELHNQSCSWKASAEGEKFFLEQKERKQKAVEAAAAKEAAIVPHQSFPNPANGDLVIQTSQHKYKLAEEILAAPAPIAVSNVSYSSDASTYPVGQCTWDKTLAILGW